MALPIDFITRTRALLGEEFDRLEAALNADVPVSIRINSMKGTPAPKAGAPVAWCESGFYLPERLSFTFDPLFHAGAYYVQEASSMFLEQAIKAYVKEPVRCLDLCAAPIVINNDPEEIGEALPHLFDVIVTDVPCSGEGMFRKDTDSTGEWSVDNVRLCASRGRRIIHDIWNALKPGGILIYSTCTYNTEEDEENIHYIIEELGAEALPIPTQEEWQITGALRFEHPVYRFFPHKTRGEGFFLAALRKAEGEIEEIRVKSKGKKERGKAAPSIPQEARLFLSDETSFSLEWNGSFLRAYPKAHSDLFSLINAKPLRVLSAGIYLGEAKGKDFIPSQELALSTALTPNAFPSVELEWEDAIKFLKKEALVLPSGTDKGYVLVRYQGLPLGFVKNLGNRANNLYPQEWRIRTGYIPEEIKLFLGR